MSFNLTLSVDVKDLFLPDVIHDELPNKIYAFFKGGPSSALLPAIVVPENAERPS